MYQKIQLFWQFFGNISKSTGANPQVKPFLGSLNQQMLSDPEMTTMVTQHYTKKIKNFKPKLHVECPKSMLS